MTRISKIMVKQLPEMQLLSLRRTIHFFEEYSDFVGEAVTEISKLIAEADSFPSSGPIVCFHTIDLEELDVEIGFQVAERIAGTDRITSASLSARTIVAAIDLGPYEQSDPVVEELMSWIPAHGYQPAGGIYYYYLNDNDRPESELLTEMYIPITQ
ncbi:GyrI-like domain-containing protein [Enterococcus sp. AZ072]|uniref:GyrI-like domain-containing protein n=1 Tax=unclassified Enterococcus TaxID=2608891 RepID=UPI003D2D2C80